MNKSNRTIVIIGVIVAVVIAFLAGRATDTMTVYEQGNNKDNQSESSESKPQKIELSGDTDTATESFHLNKGTARLEVAYTGTTQIAVSLLDEDGESVAFMMSNKMGTYNGSTLEKIDVSGEYSVKVIADGPWTVTIEQ